MYRNEMQVSDIDTFEDFEIAEGVSSSLGMDPGNPFGVQGQDD